MLAILIYMGAAGAVVLGSQVVRPNMALGNNHHRKLYWTGAAAAIGLVGVLAGMLAI